MTRAVQTRVEERLVELRAQGRKGLIVYLMAGDPNPAASADLVEAATAAGADVVELGVPFSDPLADGPVIQAAGQRALRAGTTPGRVLDLVRELRARGVSAPVVLMTYTNPLLRLGFEAFARAARASGVDGVIVPDLPHEEADALREPLGREGLALIPLVAPTTPPERVAAIARAASGFVYCVSVVGVTGARDTLSDRFAPLVAEVRRHTDLPVAVGFGIQSPEQARAVGEVADAVIVGSAVVRICAEGGDPAARRQRVSELVGSLRAALDRA